MTLAINGYVNEIYRAQVKHWPLDGGMWCALTPWAPLGERGHFFHTWTEAMEYALAAVRMARAVQAFISLQSIGVKP